jgi:hypothetical protein
MNSSSSSSSRVERSHQRSDSISRQRHVARWHRRRVLSLLQQGQIASTAAAVHSQKQSQSNINKGTPAPSPGPPASQTDSKQSSSSSIVKRCKETTEHKHSSRALTSTEVCRPNPRYASAYRQIILSQSCRPHALVHLLQPPCCVSIHSLSEQSRAQQVVHTACHTHLCIC